MLIVFPYSFCIFKMIFMPDKTMNSFEPILQPDVCMPPLNVDPVSSRFKNSRIVFR